MKYSAVLIIVALAFYGCENGTNKAVEKKSGQTNNSTKVDPDRESWQKPYEVLNLWGDQLKNKRIMEVGANDGFWTYKLAQAGANVIAADFNESRLEAIMEGAEERGLSDMIETRLITADDPMLEVGEVDQVWAVNVYSNLPDRVGFFAKVHRGLKQDGQLVLIDWLDVQTIHGPPLMERIGGISAMDEMDAAGFMDVSIRTNLLPEQWIMVAQNVPPEAYQ